MTDPLEERVVESEVVHRGRYMEFRVDTIERADGSTGTRDVVGHPGAVAVLALDDDGRLLSSASGACPPGRRCSRSPPARSTSTTASPRTPTARRGASSRRRPATERRRGASSPSFWTAPGFATELMHLYLATGMTGVGAADDRLAPDEDERIELRHVPLGEAVAMVEGGEIGDAKSILGILWLDRLRRREAEGADGVDGGASSDAAGTVIRYGRSSGTDSRGPSSPWPARASCGRVQLSAPSGSYSSSSPSSTFCSDPMPGSGGPASWAVCCS